MFLQRPHCKVKDQYKTTWKVVWSHREMKAYTTKRNNRHLRFQIRQITADFETADFLATSFENQCSLNPSLQNLQKTTLRYQTFRTARLLATSKTVKLPIVLKTKPSSSIFSFLCSRIKLFSWSIETRYLWMPKHRKIRPGAAYLVSLAKPLRKFYKLD